jgi:uncharacterized MAPEG superfamily protein
MLDASTPLAPGNAIVSASQSASRTAMTIELKMLALSIVLGLVQIVLASHASSLQRGYVWTASSRDGSVPALTGAAGRLARALQNFVETFPLFAAAVLIAHVAATHSWMTEWGVQLYFWGRVIYLALYAAGVFLLRSLVWNIATLGIVLVLLSLVGLGAHPTASGSLGELALNRFLEGQ